MHLIVTHRTEAKIAPEYCQVWNPKQQKLSIFILALSYMTKHSHISQDAEKEWKKILLALFINAFKIVVFPIFGKVILWYSGIIAGSVLRVRSCWCWDNYMECWVLNPSQHARPVTYTLWLLVFHILAVFYFYLISGVVIWVSVAHIPATTRLELVIILTWWRLQSGLPVFTSFAPEAG